MSMVVLYRGVDYTCVPNVSRYGGVGCNTMESRTRLPTLGRNLLPTKGRQPHIVAGKNVGSWP